MRALTTGLAGLLMLVSFSIAAARSYSDAEQAAGFVPVFTGHSLEGWHGDTTAWILEDGRLKFTAPFRPSGSQALLDLKLMSPAENPDLEPRFNFTLDKSANNCVAIRAPLEGERPAATDLQKTYFPPP